MSATDPSGIVYGPESPLVTRGFVERSMLAHVKAQMLPYLARIERQEGLTPEQITKPKSWEIINEFTRYPEEGMPFIAVISPGISPGRNPMQEGDGAVTAWWLLAIGAIVAARDERTAKDLAGYYGAAIRGLVMEQPELGGWASGVEWNDEKYDDFPRITERTLAAARLVFTVKVEDVVNVYGAPRLWDGTVAPPLDDPYAPPAPLPTADGAPQFEVDVTKNGG
jgi:hypothetical protein